MPIVLKVKNPHAIELRRGKEYYWETIRNVAASYDVFTVSQIEKLCDRGCRPAITNYLRTLIAAGYVEDVEPGASPMRYRLIQRPKRRPLLSVEGEPSKGGIASAGRENMWNVMRRSPGGWTAQQLAIDASTDSVTVSLSSAQRYSRALYDAGVVIDAGREARGRTIWRLKGTAIRGPLCPVIVRGTGVYDRNSKQIIGDVTLEGDAS